MHDVNNVFPRPIENPAGSNHKLAVRQTTKLLRKGTRTREFLKPFDRSQYALDEFASCLPIFHSNVIRDRVQIVKCRVSPDYFSHRSNRRLAWACVEIRPS